MWTDQHREARRGTVVPRTTPPATRLPWQAPRIALVGRVRDLVRGGGKSVANADADPQSTVKQGGG